ncbi:MAG: ComF family protein [bacterium]
MAELPRLRRDMVKEKPQMPLPVFRALSEWLYPPRCCACGAFTRDVFCEKCEKSIRYLDGSICPMCGRELPPGAGQAGSCRMCESFKYNFDTCRSALSYEGAMEKVLIKFKFRRRAIFRGILLSAMLKHMNNHPEMFAHFDVLDFIVPVPLHPLKQVQRGFNQSELLAAGVARELGRPVRHALWRVRRRRPQAKMGWKERVKNVSGAFAARGKKVEGKRVLLIDDMITTGATASECARVLKEAGAAEVHVFTLARRVWQ